MEQQEARTIGAHLARGVDSTPETEWMMWAALWAFPSSAHEDLWLPKDQAAAHWMDGQGLVSVAAEGPALLRITVRPVALGAWTINASYESAQLSDGGFVQPGLASHWVFELASGEKFEAKGQVLVNRDSFTPDDGEKLATRVAKKMLAS
jgi:hypothetical protein